MEKTLEPKVIYEWRIPESQLHMRIVLDRGWYDAQWRGYTGFAWKTVDSASIVNRELIRLASENVRLQTDLTRNRWKELLGTVCEGTDLNGDRHIGPLCIDPGTLTTPSTGMPCIYVKAEFVPEVQENSIKPYVLGEA